MKRTVLAGLFWAAMASSVYGQAPTISSVADVFTFNPRLAPGSLAAVFGNNFGTSKTITVTFGGKQAFLLAVTNTQINLQIPVDVPVGATSVVVGTSAPFNVTLAKYAPAVLTANSQGTGPAKIVSTSQGPFKANDMFSVMASGLGPTNPAVATGATTPTPAPVMATPVTATIGGMAAAVTFAGLAPGQVGAYQVNVTVPAGLPSGNLDFVLSVGGASSQAGVTVPVSGDVPGITSVVNAASGNVQGLPNGGIAQGAIFLVTGTGMGPADLAIAPTPFTSTSLLGTSVSITVNGTTTAMLMYYTSATQVAGVLPSNTPVGTGTATVTYNGATSAPAPITVVQSNAGIFTTPAGGSGAAVVTFPDYSVISAIPGSPCGGPNTACGAANPKDVLVLWLTGLGPVVPDSAGPTSGNMPNLPLHLFIGGVEAPVSYQGRSGFVGLDQVDFTVPDNVPTGCAVPVFIQIGTQISNYTWIPVANGSRSCTPTDPTITADAVAAATGGGSFTQTQFKLRRRPANNAQGNSDRADAQFQKVSVVPGMGPFVVTLVDRPPVGTCYVLNNPNLDITQAVLQFQSAIDAGPSLTLNGPNGSRTLAKTVTAGQPTDYFINIGPGYFSPGNYTVTGTGGADVGPLTATLTIPPLPVWTNQSSVATVSRADGLTITWSGGASQAVVITGISFTDKSQTTGAAFFCLAPGDAGTFTVPPSVLLALPAAAASPNGAVTVQAGPSPNNFTASGLTIGSIDFNGNQTNQVTYK